MVLVDFNGISIGSVLGQLNRGEVLSANLVKHIILNNLRTYRNRFPESDWGRMVICLEGRSWRRDIFPQYKAARQTNRDKDKYDWSEIYKLISEASADIKENFPYAVIQVSNGEADDIIGAITIEEMGKLGAEKIAIVSADKDFIQLHNLGDIVQYSPMQDKMVKEPNPGRYLFDHIFKGDSSDGVPNANSPDNSFTDKIRQKPMRKTDIEHYWDNRDSYQGGMNDGVYRNFIRNQKMIDLKFMPKDVYESSITQLDSYKYPMRGKVFNYLIENKMNMLIECASEF
jgi:hypothetical protein